MDFNILVIEILELHIFIVHVSDGTQMIEIITFVLLLDDKIQSHTWLLFAQETKTCYQFVLIQVVHCFVDNLVPLIWYLQRNYLQTLKSVLKVIDHLYLLHIYHLFYYSFLLTISSDSPGISSAWNTTFRFAFNDDMLVGTFFLILVFLRCHFFTLILDIYFHLV